MSEIDFSKYSNVDEIEKDIKDIKIQGATNVAIATFEGLKIFLSNYKGDDPHDVFIDQIEKTGYMLSHARINEPLAKNGMKFIMNILRSRHADLHNKDEINSTVQKLANEYLQFIKEAKDQIVEHSKEVMFDVDEVLTHCHSTTAERVIIERAKETSNFKAVCTETRPLYQGRLTAKALVEAGIDTTLIADSAVESFIIGKGSHDIDVIFIGCDEITMQGDVINKIGSWGVAHAAYFANKPIYVVGSILKTDVSTAYKPVEIEMREANELWDDAPEGLKMVNPAFEVVDHRMITGYITEIGVVKPEDIQKEIQKEYQWLF
jgi:eIF-2B alpha/beta/delta-like uncharacterized protein